MTGASKAGILNFLPMKYVPSAPSNVANEPKIMSGRVHPNNKLDKKHPTVVP